MPRQVECGVTDLWSRECRQISIKVELGMKREELEKIFENEETEWDGDNVLQGLNILAKYTKNCVLGSAEHDIIYSIDVDEALENGITKEDADTLRKINWMIDDDFDCFACFV